MTKKHKKEETRTVADYEKAGRLLYQIADYGARNKRHMMWLSFLRGISVGFGTVLGATILVSILLYVLSFFNEVPLLGDIVDEVTNTINQY